MNTHDNATWHKKVLRDRATESEEETKVQSNLSTTVSHGE